MPTSSRRSESGRGTDRSDAAVPSPIRGVYGISVAAELVGLGPQTLRLYESRGLIEPQRTDGGTRRYSAADLDRIRRITALIEQGLNLAGIAMVLDLEVANAGLVRDKVELQSRLDSGVPAPGRQPTTRRRR